MARPSTSPQPVTTPSAGASTPSIARWAKWGRPWMPDLDEGALVDQKVDPLAGGQLAALVLLGDLLLAAAEPRPLARLVQLLGQLVERRGPWKLVIGLAQSLSSSLRFGTADRDSARLPRNLAGCGGPPVQTPPPDVRDLLSNAAAGSRPNLDRCGSHPAATRRSRAAARPSGSGSASTRSGDSASLRRAWPREHSSSRGRATAPTASTTASATTGTRSSPRRSTSPDVGP